MSLTTRCGSLIVLASLLPSVAWAGHTRPGYVDGCQSADGRYSVTAESKKTATGDDGWQFTWKDRTSGETHQGWLVGLPFGLEHFRVAYAHIFVPPGGQTFAVFQTANFAPCDRRPPGAKEKELVREPSDAFKNYVGFADRLVIYSKTGEVLKRYAMKDLLQEKEWVFVNWVHGNLYWLCEYSDVMPKSGGEPPRCGYRYFRISPDYSTLEFTIGPNSDAKHKVKDLGPEFVNYQRTVRVSLADGKLLDASAPITDPRKQPGRPFVGDLVRRGEAMQLYRPSLDPVRVPGQTVVNGAQ